MKRSQSIALKKTMSTREKVSYMMYEFLGTFFLCYAMNFDVISNSETTAMLDPLTGVLYIVTLIAWDVSASQFNLGLTIAYMFFELEKFNETWFKHAATAIA